MSDALHISGAVKVDEREGRARLTWFSQLSGKHPGMVSVLADAVEFRLIEGRWLIKGVHTLQGVDLLRFDGLCRQDVQYHTLDLSSVAAISTSATDHINSAIPSLGCSYTASCLE